MWHDLRFSRKEIEDAAANFATWCEVESDTPPALPPQRKRRQSMLAEIEQFLARLYKDGPRNGGTGRIRDLTMSFASCATSASESTRSSVQASGADNARPERAKVLALARAHEIDAILLTELSRWAAARKTSSRPSTICTAGKLASWLRRTADLSTSSGKLMASIMVGLAEFERDVIRERVKSDLAG